MKWEAWVLIINFAILALYGIARIGKQGPVTTTGGAIVNLLMCVGFIWLVLRLA